MGAVQYFSERGSEFRFQIREEDTGMTLQCAGTLDGEACEHRIQPELARLHDLLLAVRASGVTLDVRDVEYMSSSALKALAAWFVKVAEAKAYQVRIAYHPDREWQVWSLGALRTLAPGRVRLEPVPRG